MTGLFIGIACSEGSSRFGVAGWFAGVILGLALGHLIAHLATEALCAAFLRDMKLQSNDELRAAVADNEWGIVRLLALEQLAVRGTLDQSDLCYLLKEADSKRPESIFLAWKILLKLFPNQARTGDEVDPLLWTPSERRARIESVKRSCYALPGWGTDK